MRSILILGGAPRMPVDAVRFMTVNATGTTAVTLRDLLARDGCAADMLLSIDAEREQTCDRFETRAELESKLKAWITAHPTGVLVMSAAINDYQVSTVELIKNGESIRFLVGAKIPSRGDEVVIRLKPSPKIIDQLLVWGLTGPVVGFKFEGKDTVLASADNLLRRVNAKLVVANSLCGVVQAMVDATGVARFATREAMLVQVAKRLKELALQE